MRQLFCIVCDAFNLHKGLLCTFCHGKVFLREETYFRRDVEGVCHYYLFQWTEESDVFCRRLAYFLKNQNEGVFQEWVGLFPDYIGSDHESLAAVPSASNKGQCNHALSLAVALEKLLGLICVLEIGASGAPQKGKGRKERLLEPRLEQQEKLLGLDRDWTFIDDVFVTGGTYNRVKSRIGTEPKMIVTMFYRPWVKGER